MYFSLLFLLYCLFSTLCSGSDAKKKLCLKPVWEAAPPCQTLHIIRRARSSDARSRSVDASAAFSFIVSHSLCPSNHRPARGTTPSHQLESDQIWETDVSRRRVLASRKLRWLAKNSAINTRENKMHHVSLTCLLSPFADRLLSVVMLHLLRGTISSISGVGVGVEEVDVEDFIVKKTKWKINKIVKLFPSLFAFTLYLTKSAYKQKLKWSFNHCNYKQQTFDLKAAVNQCRAPETWGKETSGRPETFHISLIKQAAH